MLLLFELFGQSKDLDSHVFDFLRNLFTTRSQSVSATQTFLFVHFPMRRAVFAVLKSILSVCDQLWSNNPRSFFKFTFEFYNYNKQY